MYERTIICLANSRKPPSGRCFAGKEIEGARAGQWTRPVSSRPGREVSEEERRYESGIKAQLLDIVQMPLERHVPAGHQVENHVLVEDHPWVKVGTATWDQVSAAVDAFDADFWVDAESTYHGLNDKVPENVAAMLRSSLKLVHLPQLRLEARLEEGYQGHPGRRRLRARFEYQRKQYLFSVTDPEVEETYLPRGNGIYPIANAAVCISLSEPWNGYAFRVVASVITEERCQQQ